MSNKSINYLILSEKELFFLLKSDDVMAFEQLYHNYKIRLYCNILRIIKAEDQAEELLKSVFANIWSARKEFDTDKPFRNHLFKTAETLVYDFFMKAALNKTKENSFIKAANIATREHLYCKANKPVFVKVVDGFSDWRKQ